MVTVSLNETFLISTDVMHTVLNIFTHSLGTFAREAGTLLGRPELCSGGWNFALAANFALAVGTLLWRLELCSGGRNFALEVGTLLGRPELCSGG